MKTAQAFALILLVTLYGLPLTANADTPPLTLALPEARASEVYSADIEAVLRMKYRLKIETAARTSILQWTFVDGELPPGLMVRSNGTVAGTPRASRNEAYRFRVQVVDIADNNPEPLFLDVSVLIASPRLRLTKISAPTLAPVDEEVAPGNRMAVGERVSVETGSLPGRSASAANGGGDASGRESYGSTDSAVTFGGGVAPGAAPAPVQSCAECSTSSCPFCLPQTDASKPVITIDARGGAAKGGRKFKKGQEAQVVVTNKNPYIRAYTTKIDEKTVEETALNTFLPLLGPFIADQFKEASGEDAKKTAADAKSVAEKSAGDKAAAAICPDEAEIAVLERFKDRALTEQTALKRSYDDLARDHKDVAGNYKKGVEALSNPQASCDVLYCTSLSLRTQMESRVSDARIKATQDISTRLKNYANTLKDETEFMRRNHPACTAQFLNEFSVLADGLLSRAAEADAALNKVREDNKNFDKAVETINVATRDARNFAEVHVIPQKRSTDIATVTLSAKKLKSLGGEPEGESSEIAKVEVQFGDAPYFAVSGGLAASTLRRIEYQRVQGFATNRQGEITGTELTSVAGVKEDSSTRISPLVMLHGRLYRPKVETFGFSGLHWSLGVTGKNDNKGTDIEYLVGPSASFLDDKLFFTVGGYAGKQQTLAGNLFPGAEVPKDLAEIPVNKNYHWKIGFGLTYKLPVFK